MGSRRANWLEGQVICNLTSLFWSVIFRCFKPKINSKIFLVGRFSHGSDILTLKFPKISPESPDQSIELWKDLSLRLIVCLIKKKSVNNIFSWFLDLPSYGSNFKRQTMHTMFLGMLREGWGVSLAWEQVNSLVKSEEGLVKRKLVQRMIMIIIFIGLGGIEVGRDFNVIIGSQ